MKNDAKAEFKSYANSFQAVTVPGLARVGALCDMLGNPERELKFIHIAGTNGKGSTSACMANILEDAG
jgi:dihydrofolate synthase/folylpolyglutamate synthase